VVRQRVLKSQLFFLEAVEKVFVGVSAVLFFFDQRVQRLMLRFDFLDGGLVHECPSFRERD
jgi:hypothetical protein